MGSLADPSTRPLSEVARHLIVPSGIVDTLWFDVEERCREFGDEFDAWQDGLGQLALGIRADGMFAATVGGVTFSIPRQVAKTFIVMRIVVALCTLFPDLTVVWTAHRTRTATNTFQKMKALCLRPSVRPYIRPGSNQGTAIRDANGEQEIPFANGSRIMFGAREQGFGRGFDEVDVEVFDEAQILTEKALEDMVAATNQSRFVHGALLFYMGTPPRPVDPGEVFTQRRVKALEVGRRRDAGETVEFDGLYVECSADPEKARANPDDHGQWAEANPSYPHRTPLVSLLRLRENLPGDDSWLREALGVWDELATVNRVISPELWARLGRESAPDGKVSYGVKFSPDGATVALAVAVRHEFGVHVEGVQHVELVHGTQWLVDWLSDRRVDESGQVLLPRWRECGLIVVDGKSGAGAFTKALISAGVQERRALMPSTDQAIAAHAALLEAVTEGTVSHNDDEALNAAVRCAGRRPIGTQGGWGFQPLDGGDVTLLEAATHAHFGALTAKVPTRSGGRRAVVL